MDIQKKDMDILCAELLTMRAGMMKLAEAESMLRSLINDPNFEALTLLLQECKIVVVRTTAPEAESETAL